VIFERLEPDPHAVGPAAVAGSDEDGGKEDMALVDQAGRDQMPGSRGFVAALSPVPSDASSRLPPRPRVDLRLTSVIQADDRTFRGQAES
jgi:hypothetical protein